MLYQFTAYIVFYKRKNVTSTETYPIYIYIHRHCMCQNKSVYVHFHNDLLVTPSRCDRRAGDDIFHKSWHFVTF